MIEAPTAVRPKQKRWPRLLIGGVGLLLATEIGLRLIFGLGNPILSQPDPSCGYLCVPDQHVVRFFSHNDINHFGMRSPDIVMPAPADRLRVLVIGDSVTYGTTSLDQPAIFTSRLADQLPAVRHQPVDVLNISAGGWSPGNEVGYLLSRGTFDAKVVVLVLNSGDLAESFAGLSQGDLNFPTARPWTAVGETFSRYLLPRIKGKVFRDPGTTLPSPEEVSLAEARNLQLLDQANAFVARTGAVFAVAYVPFAGWKAAEIEAPERALARWAGDHQVPYLDITPALTAEDSKVTTIDGLHLRARGHEIVADEIVRQWPLIEAALARRSPATRETSPSK